MKISKAIFLCVIAVALLSGSLVGYLFGKNKRVSEVCARVLKLNDADYYDYNKGELENVFYMQRECMKTLVK